MVWQPSDAPAAQWKLKNCRRYQGSQRSTRVSMLRMQMRCWGPLKQRPVGSLRDNQNMNHCTLRRASADFARRREGKGFGQSKMAKESVHAVAGHAVSRANDRGDNVPLLTVIVPVYNEAETISEQFARILATPYSKQVIVVDDGFDRRHGRCASGLAGPGPIRSPATRREPRNGRRDSHCAAPCAWAVHDHSGCRLGIRSGRLSAIDSRAAGRRGAGRIRVAVFARNAERASMEKNNARGPRDQGSGAERDKDCRPARNEYVKRRSTADDETDNRPF